ncbi:MAG: hypothetical protein AAGL18_09545 [Pseudomonadota bacterium]
MAAFANQTARLVSTFHRLVLSASLLGIGTPTLSAFGAMAALE